METRANFALIGAFALCVIVGVFAFVYWVSGPSKIAEHRTYKLVVPGSVAGLSKGGSVEFNGVKVGEVAHIAISEKDPSRVDVLINVERNTPIKTNTRARLEGKGFTGVAVVELVGGSFGAAMLEAKPGEEYPVIEAERSEFQNLLANAQTLSIKAAQTLEKIDALLEANSGTITNAMKNVESVTKTLAENRAPMAMFIQDAADIAKSLKPVAARLDKMLAAAEQAIKALDPRKLKSITGDIAGASANLNRFSATGLREYEQLAVEGRKTLQAVDRAVKSLERDPSQVIFGPSQSVPEVEGR